jgi:hypothetical protein
MCEPIKRNNLTTVSSLSHSRRPEAMSDEGGKFSELIESYEQSSDDGECTDENMMDEYVSTTTKVVFRDVYTPTGFDKEMDKIISMLVRKQSDLAIYNLACLLCMDPEGFEYPKYLDEVTQHGTDDMKQFLEEYMAKTSTTKLAFYNKLSLEKCLHKFMQKRHMLTTRKIKRFYGSSVYSDVQSNCIEMWYFDAARTPVVHKDAVRISQVAFAMGKHERLGAESLVQSLHPEVVNMILDLM